MTINKRRPTRKPFPRELAEMITRKADNMARRFEEQAMQQLVRDAQRALDRGASVEQIVRELGLPCGGGLKL